MEALDGLRGAVFSLKAGNLVSGGDLDGALGYAGFHLFHMPIILL